MYIKWGKQGRDSAPCPNTGNYIGFNVCDGKLKLEGTSAISENGCVFENNVIVGRNDERKDIVNNNGKQVQRLLVGNHLISQNLQDSDFGLRISQ